MCEGVCICVCGVGVVGSVCVHSSAVFFARRAHSESPLSFPTTQSHSPSLLLFRFHYFSPPSFSSPRRPCPCWAASAPASPWAARCSTRSPRRSTAAPPTKRAPQRHRLACTYLPTYPPTNLPSCPLSVNYKNNTKKIHTSKHTQSGAACAAVVKPVCIPCPQPPPRLHAPSHLTLPTPGPLGLGA